MLFSIFFVFRVACTVVEASAPPKNCVPVLDGTATSLKGSSSSVARPTSSKNVLQPSGSVEVVGNNDSCSCGYVLTKHNNAYFRHHFATNFSELPKGPAANGSSFKQHGWIITADEKVGGASPDGVKCRGKASNIRISGQGTLELVMPGGQNTATKELFGAEMKFYAPAAHGVFTVNSKVSKEPGACQAFVRFPLHNDSLDAEIQWTNYHDKQAGNKDEQDIEVLGHALMDVGTLGAGEYGLWMTNWDVRHFSIFKSAADRLYSQTILQMKGGTTLPGTFPQTPLWTFTTIRAYGILYITAGLTE